MLHNISFILDDKIETLSFGDEHKPTDTVLNFLRKKATHKGVKEGCAEGDCGACTVVLASLNNENKLEYKAIDSCLLFLPMLQGKQLITVENLASVSGDKKYLHPVQEALMKANGSQCGFCTPGIVMSMFSLYKSKEEAGKERVEDALTGNLCRCTGYKPIIDASVEVCRDKHSDHFDDTETDIINKLMQLRKSNESVNIKTETQQYFQPITLTEALALRKSIPSAILVNGATDVALRVTKRHEVLREIINLSRVKELNEIKLADGILEVGAGINLEVLKSHTKNVLPALHKALCVFGSKQIRELATIGGNIGSGSPIGDTLPLLLVYDAEILLVSESGERKLKLKDYLISYRKTALRQDEIIRSVYIPIPPRETIHEFYKVSKRKDLDISTLSAAFKLRLNGNVVEEIKIAFGGMAEITKHAALTEQFFVGKAWERKTVEEAVKLLEQEFTPISDARSGAEFRMTAAKNLVLKFWFETVKNL